jgi:hypothetical protein
VTVIDVCNTAILVTKFRHAFKISLQAESLNALHFKVNYYFKPLELIPLHIKDRGKWK